MPAAEGHAPRQRAERSHVDDGIRVGTLLGTAEHSGLPYSSRTPRNSTALHTLSSLSRIKRLLPSHTSPCPRASGPTRTAESGQHSSLPALQTNPTSLEGRRVCITGISVLIRLRGTRSSCESGGMAAQISGRARETSSTRAPGQGGLLDPCYRDS